MINPLEVVIQAMLVAAPSLAGGRIASKHHYVSPQGATDSPGLWNISDSSIVIGLDGGAPELDLPVHDIRLEVRCFAGNQSDALNLLLLFRATASVLTRLPVTVTGGTGLLYYMLPESGPSLLFDPDLSKDFALQFYRARIHE